MSESVFDTEHVSRAHDPFQLRVTSPISFRPPLGREGDTSPVRCRTRFRCLTNSSYVRRSIGIGPDGNNCTPTVVHDRLETMEHSGTEPEVTNQCRRDQIPTEDGFREHHVREDDTGRDVSSGRPSTPRVPSADSIREKRSAVQTGRFRLSRHNRRRFK